MSLLRGVDHFRHHAAGETADLAHNAQRVKLADTLERLRTALEA